MQSFLGVVDSVSQNSFGNIYVATGDFLHPVTSIVREILHTSTHCALQHHERLLLHMNMS
jgi:hypothetical protein